jgi:hypothetical protein
MFTLKIKQTYVQEIRLVCNIARTGGTFLSLPIQAAWLDRLPSRRRYTLISANQCTFLIAAQILLKNIGTPLCRKISKNLK